MNTDTIAIVAPALDMNKALADVRSAFTAYRHAVKTAGERRYELGKALVQIRPAWPRSGPNARGWGEFLAREGINEDVALEAMKYAGHVETEVLPAVQGKLGTGDYPTLVEAGVRGAPEMPPAASEMGVPPSPPLEDGDAAPPAPPAQAAEPEVEIDRDTWCTPKWITDALGPVDLDPCANVRSHVQARVSFDLELRGEDGLVNAAGVGHLWRTFVNPPFSNVRPWIDAYKHTRFCFLLKLDPSTKWFAALFAVTERILIPRGTRVEFEAPPGVAPEKASANPFPHALFFARAGDVPAALLEQCFDWITHSK